MKLIAIPFNTFEGQKAHIVACTDDEYEKYMEHGEINEFTVSASFVRQYLAERGYTSERLEEVYQKATTSLEDSVFKWLFSNVLTVPNLKVILNEFDLSYHELIDAYAEHLKSL